MIWNKVSVSSFSDDAHTHSFWLRLQLCFNKMIQLLLIPQERKNHSPLRLVLDDDKIHCDGLKCKWENIKKVKHEKCNRFGANMHSLAGSISSIIYGISVERDNYSTFDSVEECLLSAFPKRNDNKFPNLNNTIIGFDRGYNGFLKLVSYILRCGGHTYGTSKRALHNIFTYDQKQRDWDKRVFRSKEGARIVERMICPMKDENNNKVGDLMSLFYRNGYGGAILMQSTLPEDQVDRWDRVLACDRSEDLLSNSAIYKSHSFFLRLSNDLEKNTLISMVARHFESKIIHVTMEQNKPEWFICRMFCITASAAEQYINIGRKLSQYNVKYHWKKLQEYFENHRRQTSTPSAASYDDTHYDVSAWANALFTNCDGMEWLRNPNNLENLQRSTSSEYNPIKWKAIQKVFQVVSHHTRGYTTITGVEISNWVELSDDEKLLYDLDSTDKLRKKLRELVPKQIDLYKRIKYLNCKHFTCTDSMTASHIHIAY